MRHYRCDPVLEYINIDVTFINHGKQRVRYFENRISCAVILNHENVNNIRIRKHWKTITSENNQKYNVFTLLYICMVMTIDH